MIEKLRARIYICTRIQFVQRWVHRNGFCDVERCPL